MFLALVLWSLLVPPSIYGDDESLTIAFGSCARQEEPQPIWNAIIETKPDAFLFIGDTVYADTIDPLELRAALEQLGKIDGFQRLRRTCPVYAVWDDHDFGLNDGGAEHPNKRQTQKVFLDFFGTPADEPVRNQEGIYRSFVIGKDDRRVQVVLLDTRYNRGPLTSVRLAGRRLYTPNLDESVTMLGETQWKWLEEQLLGVGAEIRIVVSSIQVIPDDHPAEKWANLPHERKRFLKLLREAKGQILLLSGDQHLGEISVLEMPDGIRLYEFTSSGMTHTRGTLLAINRHRLGFPVVKKNYGVVAIQWQSKPQISLALHGESGEVLMEVALPDAQPTHRTPE